MQEKLNKKLKIPTPTLETLHLENEQGRNIKVNTSTESQVPSGFFKNG